MIYIYIQFNYLLLSSTTVLVNIYVLDANVINYVHSVSINLEEKNQGMHYISNRRT